jgi:hypothetical protein
MGTTADYPTTKSVNLVTSGLQLYLDAGQTTSYSGTGTTWTDLSGNSRNATMSGTLPFSTFNSGYFGPFTDSNYFSLSNSGLVPRTGDFTWSVWIYYNSTDSADTIIENGSWTDTLLWRYENGNTITVYAEGALGGSFSWSRTLNTWYNLVLMRRSGVCYFYVNGVSTGTPFSFTTDVNLANPTIFIGRSQHATTQTTDGRISIVKIYNRALTDAEITTNYNFFKNRYTLINGVISSGLQLYLDAGQTISYPGTGSTWTDISGNGRNGTLVASPTFSNGAFTFNGSTQYVNFGDILDLGTNDLTVNIWARPTTLTAATYYTMLSKTIAAAQNYRYAVNFYGNSLNLLFVGNNNSVVDAYTTSTINTNTWYMFTFVFTRNSSLSAYVNGVSQSFSGSTTISQFNGQDFQSANPFRVATYTASDNSGIAAPFAGNISAVQIYFRSLSQEEITQNFNDFRGRYGI